MSAGYSHGGEGSCSRASGGIRNDRVAFPIIDCSFQELSSQRKSGELAEKKGFGNKQDLEKVRW